ISAGNKIKLEIDSMKGASVQDCVNISRLIESSLDREKEDFELEVSTPGLLSPLKVPEQFQKIIGKNVELSHNNGETHKGILLDSNNQEITIEVKKKIKEEGKKKKIEIKEEIKVLLTDIKAIKQQISFK
ncbi:MAG: ribosome assembly cofactor RimP, partial [Bacteroidales bacterium]|nr:ribosome assembly cofactor RimP [Bacteroidales bacterium]